MRHRLMSAVERGDVAAVRALLDQGADIDEVDHVDEWASTSAVRRAAELGNVALVRLLLEAGATDRTFIQDSLLSPTLTALWLQYGGDADAFLDENHGTTILMVAARGGNVEVLRLLLDAGTDPDRKDEHGRSALAIAGEEGQLDAYELLWGRTSPQAREGTSYGRDPLKHTRWS